MFLIRLTHHFGFCMLARIALMPKVESTGATNSEAQDIIDSDNSPVSAIDLRLRSCLQHDMKLFGVRAGVLQGKSAS